MTHDELMTLFKDFWPALKCWGDQEIEDWKLILCWEQHISGEPYTLPEWIDSKVTIHPKNKG
ncbi:MAG: hypothetical protein ACK54Y_00265 [Bacteroidota bacterium]|jgi:hypothetical protein